MEWTRFERVKGQQVFVGELCGTVMQTKPGPPPHDGEWYWDVERVEDGVGVASGWAITEAEAVAEVERAIEARAERDGE